jgi:hypothetical protein
MAHSTPTDQKSSNAPIFVHSSTRPGRHYTTKLPPHSTKVATKTPAATRMAGAQTKINNQLKAVAATATETATTAMMTNENKGSGSGGGSLVAARRQRSGPGNGSLVAAMAAAHWQLRQRSGSAAAAQRQRSSSAAAAQRSGSGSAVAAQRQCSSGGGSRLVGAGVAQRRRQHNGRGGGIIATAGQRQRDSRGSCLAAARRLRWQQAGKVVV